MANHPEGLVEAVGASVASKGLYAGGVAGLVGWLTQVNWVGVGGVVLALLGFFVNTWFQMRRDRRETRESEARIQALKDQCQR